MPMSACICMQTGEASEVPWKDNAGARPRDKAAAWGARDSIVIYALHLPGHITAVVVLIRQHSHSMKALFLLWGSA